MEFTTGIGQQIWRFIRLFGVALAASVQVGGLPLEEGAVVAGIVAAVEVAWRQLSPAVPADS
jgi:hypothetical protein